MENPAKSAPVKDNGMPLRCPDCKKHLDQDDKEYHCASCDRFYPVTDDGISAFFVKPDHAIAHAYSQLHKAVKRWQSQSDRLGKTLKSSERKRTLLPILKAMSDNREIFERLASRLESHVKPAVLLDLDSNQSLTGYGYDFAYLARDWCDLTESRLQIKRILTGVKRCMRLADTRGRACVLGMGTGRIGLELTEFFTEVWGIDASYGQIAQYHNLLNEKIVFWRINTKNQIHQKNLAQKLTASIPGQLSEQTKRVKYVWADALNSPFTGGYFDWVTSVYFSDVKPLPKLIEEVKRILKPGGYFLHYGPLEYHFNDFEHHYAFDEFMACFTANGFEIIHESTSHLQNVVHATATLVKERQYIDKILLLRLKGTASENS